MFGHFSLPFVQQSRIMLVDSGYAERALINSSCFFSNFFVYGESSQHPNFQGLHHQGSQVFRYISMWELPSKLATCLLSNHKRLPEVAMHTF